MIDLPKPYAWLAAEQSPRMLIEARKLYGVTETQGPGNTPAIMAWADELGDEVYRVYSGDSTRGAGCSWPSSRNGPESHCRRHPCGRAHGPLGATRARAPHLATLWCSRAMAAAMSGSYIEHMTVA